MGSSSSPLTFKLHTRVISNIYEHISQFHPQASMNDQSRIDMSMRPLTDHPPTVYGCVIGVNRGCTAEIFDSFKLPYDPATCFLDQAFLNEQHKRYTETCPNFCMLGWYASGHVADKSSMVIHKALMNINRSPICVILDPHALSALKDLPLTICGEVVRARMEDLCEFSQPLVVLAQGVVEHTRYKNLLQDYMQKRKGPMPVYRTIDAGSTTDVAFISTVFIDGGDSFTSDKLPQKKLAEQQAAKIALRHLSRKRKDEGCRPVPEENRKRTIQSTQLVKSPAEEDVLVTGEKEWWQREPPGTLTSCGSAGNYPPPF